MRQSQVLVLVLCDELNIDSNGHKINKHYNNWVTKKICFYKTKVNDVDQVPY